MGKCVRCGHEKDCHFSGGCIMQVCGNGRCKGFVSGCDHWADDGDGQTAIGISQGTKVKCAKCGEMFVSL